MHDIGLALQQMQAKIDALEKRIAALERAAKGPTIVPFAGGDPTPEEKK